MNFGVNTRLLLSDQNGIEGAVGKAQRSYRFGDLDRCRLYVVVTFELWKVRCLRVMHIDRDGGWLGPGLLDVAPLRNSERRQAIANFGFVSGRPVTNMVTAVQPEGREVKS